jgi:putative transposase
MYEWTLRQWKLNFSRIDRWLDESKGCRFLEDKRLAEVVVEALFHFAGKRYDLLGFVVMPSHLHWVFRPLKERVKKLQPGIRVRTPRERIIHSINRWTAARCNQLLKRSGEFWQHECYDHWVRSAEEMQRILEYIDDNPVKAGLVPFPEEWLWSSAWYRTKRGLKVGEPLMRIEPAS